VTNKWLVGVDGGFFQYKINCDEYSIKKKQYCIPRTVVITGNKFQSKMRSGTVKRKTLNKLAKYTGKKLL
jgi:hypothetical protein